MPQWRISLYAVSPVASARIWHFPKRLAFARILAAAAAVFISSAWDYAVLLYRAAGNPGIGQVKTTSYGPVLPQNGKTQFHFNPPQAQTSGELTFSAGRIPPVSLAIAIARGIRISNYLVKFLYNGNSCVLNGLCGHRATLLSHLTQ
jgi:hypothetical protein